MLDSPAHIKTSSQLSNGRLWWKICSNRQICPLGSHPTEEAPLSVCRARGMGLRHYSWEVSVPCNYMAPEKKPNYFIQLSFYTSSITLGNSLWHQEVTEVLNKLWSVAKLEIGEGGTSQQVYQNKEAPCTYRNVPCTSTLAFQAFTRQCDYCNETSFFRIYSLYLDIDPRLGKWKTVVHWRN